MNTAGAPPYVSQLHRSALPRDPKGGGRRKRNGSGLIHGVQSRDYPVVQGGILLIATIVITVNLIVDMLYGVINPRIRHG